MHRNKSAEVGLSNSTALTKEPFDLPPLEFLLVDVFTERPLAGNQLAVVLNVEALDDGQMQALAHEFNYSETTFILPARQPKADWRLRSFTPSSEVFGAGHNALGAWWVLADRGVLDLKDPLTWFLQELGEEVLPVGIYSEDTKPRRVSMTQGAPRFGDKLNDRRALALALGLDSSDVDVEGLEAQAISTGAMHLLVPIGSLSALERVRVDAKALISLVQPLGCEGCYLFCLNRAEHGSVARTRAFFPGIGITEDPATGSAAGPLGVYLVSRNLIKQGVWVTIEQGFEMGRPSRIEVRVQDEQVEVAGECVIVAEGTLTL